MTKTSCLYLSGFTRQENRMKLTIYTLVPSCKLINIPPTIATYVFREVLKAKECWHFKHYDIRMGEKLEHFCLCRPCRIYCGISTSSINQHIWFWLILDQEEKKKKTKKPLMFEQQQWVVCYTKHGGFMVVSWEYAISVWFIPLYSLKLDRSRFCTNSHAQWCSCTIAYTWNDKGVIYI